MKTKKKNKKARHMHKNKDGQWSLECTFNNKKELDDFMEKESWWSYRGSTETVKGKKVLYRCNRVKRLSKEQCDAGVYVIGNTVYARKERMDGADVNNGDDDGPVEASKTYMLSRKHASHTHDNLPGLVETVAPYVRRLIIEQYKNGRKAKTIAHMLSDNSDIKKEDVP